MTKSGAKGASVIHPNDIALNVGAQLVLLTGPDSVRLNVFSPCEGFMQEALWSGTEHMWSSVPAAVFTSSAVCPHHSDGERVVERGHRERGKSALMLIN